jgi:hypothetical protein
VQPLFCHSWEHALWGGNETETCHSNTLSSIYRMGNAPAFVIKGDACAFVMEDGMGDTPAFVIKGDAPLEMSLLYLHNQRCAIGMCVSLLSQKRLHLRYKLNWVTPKRIASPFCSPPSQFHSSMMRVSLIFPDRRRSHLRMSLICVSDLSFSCSAHNVGTSCFNRSKTIACERISVRCLRFEFLTWWIFSQDIHNSISKIKCWRYG